MWAAEDTSISYLIQIQIMSFKHKLQMFSFIRNIHNIGLQHIIFV